MKEFNLPCFHALVVDAQACASPSPPVASEATALRPVRPPLDPLVPPRHAIDNRATTFRNDGRLTVLSSLLRTGEIPLYAAQGIENIRYLSAKAMSPLLHSISWNPMCGYIEFYCSALITCKRKIVFYATRSLSARLGLSTKRLI